MLYKDGTSEGVCVKENFDVGQVHHGCPGAQIRTTRLFVHTNHGSLAELQAYYCFKLHFKRICAPHALFRAVYEKWVQECK
jgi:hypothetical protein